MTSLMTCRQNQLHLPALATLAEANVEDTCPREAPRVVPPTLPSTRSPQTQTQQIPHLLLARRMILIQKQLTQLQRILATQRILTTTQGK